MRTQLFGLVVVLASVVLGDALVRNGGFEGRPGGPGHPWQMRKGQQADWVAREDGGGHCARLRATSEKETPLWVQQNLALVGGQPYMVGYSVKGEPGTQYRVYVEWWRQDGKYGRCTSAAWRTANGGWEESRFRFTFPEGMKLPYIVLQLQGPGEVRFDDVAVAVGKVEATKEGCVFSAFFETGAPTWEFAGGCRVVTQSAREGKACLQVAGRKKGDDPSAVRRGIPTRKGVRYRLSYAVRAAGGSDESTGFQYFRVFTSWAPLVKDGRNFGGVGQHDGADWQDCFGAWQTRTLEFEVPEKPAGDLFLTCQVRGPGSVCFDALELREIGQVTPPPPIEFVLDRPPYRDTFFPGEADGSVRGVVRATRPGVARVRVRLARGERELRVSGRVGGEARFELPAAVGALTATAFDAAGKPLGRRIRLLSKAAAPTAGRRVVPRADGVLLVDGDTPVFPIGMWHAPGSDRALAELAAAGVNVFRCNGTQETVERLADFGLFAVPSVPNSLPDDPEEQAAWREKAAETVQMLSPLPNVLAYYLVDEPLWCGKPLAPLLGAYEFYRRADPWHPVWLNAAPRGTVEDLARYNQACDISGVDIYPVPEGGSHSEMEDRTVTSVGGYTRKMLESTDHRKPVWMTLQGFAWKHLDDRKAQGAVFPTFAQSRFMAYDAVVHGAGGIMYWGTHYIARPEDWDVLLATTRDLASVSAVLAGKPVDRGGFEVEGDGLAWCARRVGGDEFLIVVNESPSAVSLTVRTPWTGGRLNVLSGPAYLPESHVTRRLGRGKFRDRLGPYEARIYTTATSWPATPPLLVARPYVGELSGRSLREQARYLRDTEVYQGKANWIWFPGTSGVAGSACVLRHVFDLPAAPREAWLVATGDDEFALKLNGEQVAEDNSWSRAQRVSVGGLLKQGRNVITVVARDAGQAPCGFLCDLRLVLADGKEVSVLSDGTWRAAQQESAGWGTVGFDDADWPRAEVVAPYGQGPWGKRLLLEPGRSEGE